MGKIIFLTIIGILFFLSVSIAGSSYEIKDKISENVKSKIDKEKEVRVFVNLKEEDKIRRFANFEDLQEGIIDSIGEEKVKFKFDDSISAVVNKNDLEKLEKDWRVESVEEVGVREFFLQDSVGQVNTSLTYSLQVGGVNLTGKDTSICIIDSGVNYSHPDLGGCWGNNSDFSCKIVGGWDYCADDASCTTSDDDPMDVHGHGTHVSGIAAANGTINGVAPESKIIIIKACNSTGSCYDDAIKSGIDWCINNASIFNISVISMSLGSGLNTNYCNNDPLASDINNAVGNNIAVVVASGNDGSTSQISAPACVQNATPVGSIRKDDLTFDYNRNSLVQLLAPGVNINSTYLSATGYAILSGTSMSTPHAAGAIAIISQFLNLTGQSKTPEEIESVLNKTGKRVYDSGSDLNYSSIKIYDAIISLDIDNPNVTLVSPANNTVSININQSFTCNATDLAMDNVTFYLWNSSSNVINSTFSDISGASYSFEINVSNLSNGDYDWNCLFYDENSNSSFASSNFSLTVSDVGIRLISPSDNLFTNQNQTYTCNVTSTNYLNNVTFYLWNSSGVEVTSIFENISGAVNSSSFSYNFTYEDSYDWNCLFINNISASGFASGNFSLTYDLTDVEINVASPLNLSWHNVGRFNVTLNENGSCLYSLDFGANNFSMSSTNNRDFNAVDNTLLQGEDYNVTFYCNDTAGNLNSTERRFNIDLTDPNVSLVNPGGGHSVTGAQEILFEYNVSDNLNLTQCDLILDESSVALNASKITNETNNISYTVSVGSYTWNINCTDEAGNTGNSSSRSLTISSASSPVSQGSSGGGGGGDIESVKTYSPSSSEVSEGYTRDLKKNDKIVFEIFDEKFVKHNLTVDFVGEDFVNLTIQSEPIKVVLGIGQSIKLSLTSPNYYDLFIKLEDIANGKAKLTIQTIRDPIISEVVREEESVVDEEGEIPEKKDEEEVPNYFWYVIGSLIVIGVVLLLVRLRGIWFKKEIKKEVIKEVKKEMGKKREKKK